MSLSIYEAEEKTSFNSQISDVLIINSCGMRLVGEYTVIIDRNFSGFFSKALIGRNAQAVIGKAFHIFLCAMYKTIIAGKWNLSNTTVFGCVFNCIKS